mmetsp:Transcript_90933/g.259565  ORF Transcript_90933/g.259565 Transcript_90933/m.259565 type:complete len:102 (+) Transcript_90933:407-712(+)
MLLGELVVSDGIIAYISQSTYFKTNFDLTAAFKNRNKRAYYLFLVVAGMIPFICCYAIIDKMCLTSVMDSGGHIAPEWVLTRCPPPPSSLLDVRGGRARVG